MVCVTINNRNQKDSTSSICLYEADSNQMWPVDVTELQPDL